jgi:nucleotide-binding universal stress UspA family protein
MTFRDVLVHVKHHETWSEHINVASLVAKNFGARLTGMYTLADLALLKHAFGPKSQAVREREIADAATAAAAEGRFRFHLKNSEVEGDWAIGEGRAGDLLTWASRFHDLMVVEQTDPRTDEIGFEAEIQCVLEGGCPTLVVPSKGTFSSIGPRILIAWNGSREARLAVHGALPFLERADHVELLLGQPRKSFRSITRYPNLLIADYVRRRNPSVRARVFDVPDADAGAEILSAAKAANCDLVVMGAFGRSWLREWLLGGATLHVLGNAETPVLLAH